LSSVLAPLFRWSFLDPGSGYYVERAAIALVGFTLATAMPFYPYWSASAADRAELKNGFLEYVSIIGGCLLLIAAGPGKLLL